MSNQSFEIEIKSLLGNKENADKLISAMKAKDPGLVESGSHKQLNHYFVPKAGSVDGLKKLYESVKDILAEETKQDSLKDLAEKAKDYSLRTRWADGKVILVLKASVDDTTSSNGTARLEWESRVNLELEELDKLVLDAGFEYQAKWSRERQEYVYHPNGRGREVSVSVDKNAGYGYLSEFEVVAQDESKADEIKAFIRESMASLGIEELPQDRLARMFDFYNKNWEQYYGTDNIFNIE